MLAMAALSEKWILLVVVAAVLSSWTSSPRSSIRFLLPPPIHTREEEEAPPTPQGSLPHLLLLLRLFAHGTQLEKGKKRKLRVLLSRCWHLLLCGAVPFSPLLTKGDLHSSPVVPKRGPQK